MVRWPSFKGIVGSAKLGTESEKLTNLYSNRHTSQIVFLSSREDFFNVDLEGFVVPTSDQGASDRGLIVAFMVARENREDVEKMLLLLGHRLVLRVSKVQFETVMWCLTHDSRVQRSLNAVSIRLRPALSTVWQKWSRLMPVVAVEPDADLDPRVPMLLFLSCAAVGMIPRSFWRAFPILFRRYAKQTSKSTGAMSYDDEENEDDEEDED